MFDLNEKINLWRRNLAQPQTLSGSDIDELESHLREETENLTALNLSDDEAFLVATHRLGQPHSISEEFAKVNASVLWRKRFFRAGAIIFAWLIFSICWFRFLICLAYLSRLNFILSRATDSSSKSMALSGKCLSGK